MLQSTDGVMAGGTAGVVVETALYPIDTIKTRLQAGYLGTVYTAKNEYTDVKRSLRRKKNG